MTVPLRPSWTGSSEKIGVRSDDTTDPSEQGVRTPSRGVSEPYGGAVDRSGVEWLATRPQQTMLLSAGTRLGHYDVTALIGEGGMGQVWRVMNNE